MSSHQPETEKARQLRRFPTKAESILWSVLRAGQLCDLKFRRQHPIAPYFADFACPSERLVIELDGGYHEVIESEDLQRQVFLETQGWKVLRFHNKEVIEDVEAVLIAIAKFLDKVYQFKKRNASEVIWTDSSQRDIKHR